MNFDNDDLMIAILENEYLETRNKKDDNNSENESFPSEWFSSSNKEKKIEILLEALHKNIDIEDTDLYQDIIEKVL